jgi:hypothetical protein
LPQPSFCRRSFLGVLLGALISVMVLRIAVATFAGLATGVEKQETNQ